MARKISPLAWFLGIPTLLFLVGGIAYVRTGIAQEVLVSNIGAAASAVSGCGTLGGILFNTSATTGGCDATNLYWDNTNKRVGIGTNIPSFPLSIVTSSANDTPLASFATSASGGLGMYFGTVGSQSTVYLNRNGNRYFKIQGLGGSNGLTFDFNSSDLATFGGAAVQMSALSGAGSTPAVSNCGTIGTGSKNTAGFITSTTTGTCISTITFVGYAATTGWSCGITNATTANLITQTGSSTTSATFSGTTVTGDTLRFGPCAAY